MIEPTRISVTDLRVRTREIMERVKYKGDYFLVQTFGQPTAIIIGVEEYASLCKQKQEIDLKIGDVMSQDNSSNLKDETSTQGPVKV